MTLESCRGTPLHNVSLVMSSEDNTNRSRKTDVSSESIPSTKFSSKRVVSTNEVVNLFDPLVDGKKALNVSYTPSDVESVFFFPLFCYLNS